MTITWNPSDKDQSIILSNGDLTATKDGNIQGAVRATASKSSGKWYWEIYVGQTSNDLYIGVGTSDATLVYSVGGDAYGYSYLDNTGQKYHDNTYDYYGDPYDDFDVIGVALDLDNGKLWLAKNNVWQASGDPAAGTNEEYSGLSGTFFPMLSMYHDTDHVTARFCSNDQSYSPPSSFSSLESSAVSTTSTLDGKIRIKGVTVNTFDGKLAINTPTNLLDGKTQIKSSAIDLLDCKILVKSSTINLLDGKTDIVYLATNLLDSKVLIKDVAINLLDSKAVLKDSFIGLLDGKIYLHNLATNNLDGKTNVALSITNSLDGKVLIKGLKTNPLDGKVNVKSNATNQYDGKVKPFLTATDALDGKIILYPISNGNLILPLPQINAITGVGASFNESFSAFDVESFTGGIADLIFPFFNLEGIAKVGEVLSTNLTLPSLTLGALTGINGLATFPFLECNGNALVGGLSKGNIKFPLVKVDAKALVSIISTFEASFPELQINAKGLGGILATGNTTLYPLHLVTKSYVGPLANATISLPCLIVEGNLAHQIIGVTNIKFPILSLEAKGSMLTRDCEILKYNRWK